MSLVSGTSETGNSGQIVMRSGGESTPTGQSAQGGSMKISSGTATNGLSGDIKFSVGTSTFAEESTGIHMKAGASTVQGGSVAIAGGSSVGTNGGSIVLGSTSSSISGGGGGTTFQIRTVLSCDPDTTY